MTYEISKFGNGVAVGSGGNVNGTVHNRFGTVQIGQQVGVNHSDNAVTELTFTLTAEQLARDAVTNDAFLVAPKLPVGAVITRVVVQTKTAFTLTGTSPVINVGTEGSEATNGFSITQAQAQAVGTYTGYTLNGTWNSPIAAAAPVGVALGGTTPAVSGNVGALDVIISYIKA